MTLATDIHIGGWINPELVFIKARQIIGIPAEQPFRTSQPGLGWDAGTWIASAPGGFRSALDVSHDDGRALVSECDDYCDEPCDFHSQKPEAFICVRLDTTYGFGRNGGPRCDEVHNEVVERLGEWLDEQGLDWWARNEFDGTWHHRSAPYLIASR